MQSDAARKIARALESDLALLSEAETQSHQRSVGDTNDGARESESDPERSELPAFPRLAWRGIFAQYRDEMRKCSEASDVYNFLTIWVAAGNALGRRISFRYGMPLFTNVYGIAFGASGDFKTSACRRGSEITERAGLRVVRGIGSGEGIAAGLGEEPTLYFLEEFTSLLRPGKWEGSTLLPTLTEIFDCPERYEREYRKNPIVLNRPVCSILAATTEAWFWRDVRENDFEGGFGNRFVYLTGPRNPPVSLPGVPNLQFAIDALHELKDVREQEARLDAKAQRIWEAFYLYWRKEHFAPLEGAATKRIPAYVLKLAMTYSCLERTLPEIQAEQLIAAMQVGRYAARCAQHLIGARFSGANALRELEKRILAVVARSPRLTTSKRDLYRALARHYQNSEQFNRVFESMVRAGSLYVQLSNHRRAYVSSEPFD